MKNLFIVLALFVIIFSCKRIKDDLPTPPGIAQTVQKIIAPLYSETNKYNKLPKNEPGILLVEFKSPATQKAVAKSYMRSAEHIHTYSMKKKGNPGFFKIHTQPGQEEGFLSELKGHPDVVKAELNVAVYALQTSDSIPNDPYYNPEQMYSLFAVNVQSAWNSGNYGSPNEVTQLIDEPMNQCLPEFEDRFAINPGEIKDNGIDDDNNGYVDDYSGFNFVTMTPNIYMGNNLSHGQHTGGTILAKGNNNFGIVGVARNGKLLATPFLGTGGGYIDRAVLAVAYGDMMKDLYPATHNIGRSSNSWGGGSPSSFMDDAIRNAGENDIGFFAAAGNSAQSQDDPNTAMFPAAYAATNPWVKAILASSWDNSLAYFSNYGIKNVAIGAPGVSIPSTLPNGGIGYKSGTSMACPHAAAADHLMRSVHPEWTFLQRADSMVKYAKKVDALKPYCQAGGIIDLSAWIYKGVTDHTETGVDCIQWPVDNDAPGKPQNYRLTGNPSYGIDPNDGLGFFGNTADAPPVSDGVSGAIVYLDDERWQWGTYFPSALSGLPIRNYYPYCKYYDAWGNFSVSSDTIVVPFAGIEPPPPDTQAPTLNGNPTLSDITTSSMVVNWQAASGAPVMYYLYRNGTLRDSTTNISYADNGLTPATNYTYYYTARDAAGNVSLPSSTVSETTLNTPPPSYTVTVTATAQQTAFNPLSATVSWVTTTNGNISSIRVERKKNGAYQILPGIIPVTATSFTDNTIPNPGWYTYKVTITLVQGPVGIDEIDNPIQVKRK